MGLKAVARRNGRKVTNCEVARLFRVTERTVRYHLKREKEGAVDKRKDKPMKADAYAHIIEHWIKDSKENRPAYKSSMSIFLRNMSMREVIARSFGMYENTIHLLGFVLEEELSFPQAVLLR